MSNSEHIQTILNGTIHSLKVLLPMNIEMMPPSMATEPYRQEEMGVLIGIVGDFKGRIIIDSSSTTFGSIGAAMFGMPLEGEMLESFTGELGNMIAGNLCTHAVGANLTLDITPPTVMVGSTDLFGFKHAFRLTGTLEGGGIITILLMIDNDDE